MRPTIRMTWVWSTVLAAGVTLAGARIACAVAAEAAPKPAAAPAAKSASAGSAATAGGAKPSKKAPAGLTAAVSGPEVRGFQTFCDGWMSKLRDRETYNTAHIAWENHDGRVVGEYVGYGHDCTCMAREEPGKDPIGKITYRETRYRQEGATPSEALAAPGTIVEQSDVTEIFRFGKGRWQY